jgi:hypothetical protein
MLLCAPVAHAALVLVRLELVGVPGHQDVHIQLPLEHCQGVQVAPGNNLTFAHT